MLGPWFGRLRTAFGLSEFSHASSFGTNKGFVHRAPPIPKLSYGAKTVFVFTGDAAQAGLWYEMIRLWTMKEPMTADMPDVQLGTEGPATLANSDGGISARKPRPY